MGRCRAPRSRTFWDELGVRALGPPSGVSPAHAFLEQDAPYLAAAGLNAPLAGGLGQFVQGPLGGLRLVLGSEYAVGFGEELVRWAFGDQGDDLGTLTFRDAWLASGSGAICEPVYA